MNAAPRVCIGLPVFNGEAYLAGALDSLLAQTFADFELLILDNASTDRTQAICQAYASRDRRIRYERNTENVGAARNWYRAFELSCSEYFKWAAADDTYAPEFLARCVARLDQDASVVLCSTRATMIDAKGQVLPHIQATVDTSSRKPHVRLWHSIGTDWLCLQMYGLIRSSSLKKTRPYLGYIGWDHNTLAELALLGPAALVPQDLFFHRLHDRAWGAIVTKKKSRSELALYDPSIDWRFDFSFVDRARNYVAAVARAPLNRTERLWCYAVLAALVPTWPTGRLGRGLKHLLAQMNMFTTRTPRHQENLK